MDEREMMDEREEGGMMKWPQNKRKKKKKKRRNESERDKEASCSRKLAVGFVCVCE